MKTALIPIIKRISLNSKEYFVPTTNIIKYPIFLKSLIQRIRDLQYTYSPENKNILIYDLSKDKAKAQSELMNAPLRSVCMYFGVKHLVCFMLVLLYDSLQPLRRVD